MSDWRPDWLIRILTGLAVLLLTVILAFLLVTQSKEAPLENRVGQIEQQLDFVACLMLIPAEERVERGIAECQAFATEQSG